MRSWAAISVTDFRNLNFLGLVRRFARSTPLVPLPSGETAPPIVLKDLAGQRLSLAGALETGPVLAAFFKVNCVTSQLTFPFLQRIYEMYGGSNFTLWGISQNHPKDTELFKKKFGITFPILIDGKGYPVSNRFGLANSPTLFLIMPSSRVQITCVGFSKTELEAISNEAARATGKPALPLFEAGDAAPPWKPG